MVDIALDEHFSILLDGRNELETVTGRAEFEQSVRVMVTDLMYRSVIGEAGDENIKSKIRLQISRAAKRHGRIVGTENIDIYRPPGKPNTFKVEVQYESDSLQFEVAG